MTFDLHAAMFTLTVASITFLGVSAIFHFAATAGGRDKQYRRAMTFSAVIILATAFIAGGLA